MGRALHESGARVLSWSATLDPALLCVIDEIPDLVARSGLSLTTAPVYGRRQLAADPRPPRVVFVSRAATKRRPISQTGSSSSTVESKGDRLLAFVRLLLRRTATRIGTMSSDLHVARLDAPGSSTIWRNHAATASESRREQPATPIAEHAAAWSRRSGGVIGRRPWP